MHWAAKEGQLAIVAPSILSERNLTMDDNQGRTAVSFAEAVNRLDQVPVILHLLADSKGGGLTLENYRDDILKEMEADPAFGAWELDGKPLREHLGQGTPTLGM